MLWNNKRPLIDLDIWNRDSGVSPIECLERDLKVYAEETNESTERLFETIYSIMQRENCTYSEAVASSEGREAMYQLMLHRHWIAFHAEALRVLKTKELGLEKVGYKELENSEVAQESMCVLLDQFIDETKSHFEEQLASFE